MANQDQQSRINNVLDEIHRNIAAPLRAKHLATIAAYSEPHFHRVFKAVIGETLNVYIRRTRLEHAANQLMFDDKSSILSIAEKCGFSSLSSFNQVFKEQFGSTPGQWRKIDLTHADPPYLLDPEVKAGYARMNHQLLPEPDIVKLQDLHVAYVRHQGYGRHIRNAWLVLKAWALEMNLNHEFQALDQSPALGQQLGIHHSNPEWVQLEDCRYMACLTIEKPLRQRGIVNSFTIPGGVYAAFDINGIYGDLLPFIGKIFNVWLPNSGFKLKTSPIFVHYQKNHFLSTDDSFTIRVYVPISTL